MEPTKLLRLCPDLEMIGEALEESGLECHRFIPDPEQIFRGIMPWSTQIRPERDILYLVSPGQEESFPADLCASVSPVKITGNAGHLYIPGADPDPLLRLLLELFRIFQDQEDRMNQLTLSGGTLDDLCRLGEKLSGNPVCIHDDWFLMIGMSDGIQEIMPPEAVDGNTRGLVPRRILEDFKFDTEYDQTYSQQRCQLWNKSPGFAKCLYVNLWQGQHYRGRLLLYETQRPFLSRDYRFAECLAQRAVLMMRQHKPGSGGKYRNLDDVVISLLDGRDPEPRDLRYLLDTLGWSPEDTCLCVRLQSQLPGGSEVLGHILHMDLFHTLPGSYIMYLESQQCVVLNLTRQGLTLPELRYKLAPLCRDYCMYAGISSPVAGIRSLSQAARQSSIALDTAFDRRDGQWVLSFSDCALDYLLHSIRTDLAPRHLIAPEWLALLEHDRKSGTQYFQTLKTFLLMERDIPKTARTLIIHRTTLLYRLDRILELTGLNLDDPDRRLYLLLSLRLMEAQELTGI